MESRSAGLEIDLQALLDEKERLEGIIAEANSAKTQIQLLNRLIALKGGDPMPEGDVDVLGRPITRGERRVTRGVFPCPDCDHAPFGTKQGITMHRVIKHGYRKPEGENGVAQ